MEQKRFDIKAFQTNNRGEARYNFPTKFELVLKRPADPMPMPLISKTGLNSFQFSMKYWALISHITRGLCVWILCVSQLKVRLARKAKGNHLIKSTSLEKTQSSVYGFCYARDRVCRVVLYGI